MDRLMDWLTLGVGYCNIVSIECRTAVDKLTSIGVDLGQPGHVPPIIEKRPCIYHFLPPSGPPTFWFSRSIFLTSIRQCSLASRLYFHVNSNLSPCHLPTALSLQTKRHCSLANLI